MSEQVKKEDNVKKDIIVTAREGYSVLLDIEKNTFDIDCHHTVNLSNMFSADALNRCSSLSAHLKDGNLIRVEEDAILSEDVSMTPAKITPLREETAEHITSQYDQAARDSNRTNIELETRSNITDETRKQIQAQVQAGKEKILQTDQKLMKKAKAVQTSNEVSSQPKERQTAMTSNELTMKVNMDISPEAFAKKQAELRQKLEDSEDADEARAEQEIAEQDTYEQGE
ncbi:MAG: hypothetical protein U9R15_19630 [Chloroflexota bacterium]|nr:hypothetical protein [Chloroflexota bacterium]